MNVQEYLRRRNIPFAVIEHRPTYDAQHMAAALHSPGKEVAKTVLLRSDAASSYVVVILPATHNIRLDEANKALGYNDLELATELEISEHFPDFETGAVPPFGSQYGMATLVDESLTADDEIVFEGNNHGEAIRMKYKAFHQLEEPTVGTFSHHT